MSVFDDIVKALHEIADKLDPQFQQQVHALASNVESVTASIPDPPSDTSSDTPPSTPEQNT